MKLIGVSSVLRFAKLLLLWNRTLDMRHFFLVILILLGLIACDDGDVIVTTFDFDSVELNVCSGANDYVFFKINNINLETLSLQISTQDSILTRQDTVTFTINETTNLVNYRTFKSDIPSSYFCNSIPPTTPEVISNFSGTEGIATIFTRITDTLITGVGIEQDTSFIFTSTIVLNNIRLESPNETITQETLELGSLNTTSQ